MKTPVIRTSATQQIDGQGVDGFDPGFFEHEKILGPVQLVFQRVSR